MLSLSLSLSRLFLFSVLKNDKSTSGKSTGNLSRVFDAHQPQQQFLEKSQKLQKSQFLLGNLPPPLPLKLINFRKTAISPIFRNLWRNRRFCWVPFYLLQPLNSLILANSAIFPVLRNFWRNRGNRCFYWAPFYLLYRPLPLEFSNFSKNCDFSNCSQLLVKSQKLQKSQFLLGTLLPPLTLDLINFRKNCDFSNFSQFLLLRGNFDVSRSFGWG